MTYDKKRVAQMARDEARQGHTDLMAFSCWDAVSKLFEKAGIYGLGFSARFDTMCTHVVHTATEMGYVDEGTVIGFFAGEKLSHAMICIGGGYAAGCNNGCLFHGAPGNWTIINIAENWATINAQFTVMRAP